MAVSGKFLLMVLAILLFVAVVGVILFIADRTERKNGKYVAYVFLLPTIALLSVGLLYPAVQTIYHSFFDAAGKAFIGLDNYGTIFTSSDELLVLRNTVLWVVVTPFVATAIGLLYAFRPDQAGIKQIGLLNQIVVWLGGKPQQWIVDAPWNTFFLIVVMIWIQAGFAMTILSAAIKAIPDDIIEAARLDGVSAFGMFRFVTLPSIRPSVVVVLTTIAIGTLKVFDIVRTMTGGNFQTNVVANEFYSQSFRASNQGLGSALAVLLFLLVIPIVAYNIRQLRRSEAR